jgi:antagonist of KipI
MTLLVERPGLHTTVQDLGRPGFQHLGLGPGGAADPYSHRVANLLVGNDPGAATLEITLAGPALRFDETVLAALCGADLSASVEGEPLPLWRPAWIRAGALLTFGAPRRGARAYLAVAGGFRTRMVLGGRGTGPGLGLGPLRAGDALPLGLQPPPPPFGGAFSAPAWFAPWHQDLDLGDPRVLRLLPGPQLSALDAASGKALFEGSFRVAPASDRMGLRLAGPALALARPLERVSAPVATGTLQLPPGGAPILLLAGRQTTGGYPRLGEVASVDLPSAAQLRPGETLAFRPVGAPEALALLRAREARLDALRQRISGIMAP